MTTTSHKSLWIQAVRPALSALIPVGLEQIKELRVQTRPMYHVRFEGLALEPVEELPEVGGFEGERH